MVKGFWNKLARPIFALAPMANVTDAAFRCIIAKYSKYGGQDIGEYGKFTPLLPASGGPDVMWTEFVSIDALLSGGREKALVDFWHDKSERPIVAQIFGSDPEKFKKVAKLIFELGFDGIDINMGCPDKGVCKAGAGAELINQPERAREIIAATKEAAGNLPVSVKTRIGYDKNQLEGWLKNLLASDPAAIIIHARTKKEMSDVPAQWEEVAKAVELGNKHNPEVIILGNGDVQNIAEAEDKIRETGCDGVMIGRGIFGNPWLFNRSVRREDLPLEQRFAVMLEHTFLFEKLFKGLKNFNIMKKHYKAYVAGFDGAKELRGQLMNCKNAEEVKNVVLTAYPETIFAN